MSSLLRRVSLLEGGRRSLLPMSETIDRPPQETREQWLARQSGNPHPGLVNRRGETYAQWVNRRQADLNQCLQAQG